MLPWLQANAATLLVALAMVLLIAAVLAGLLRDRKKGASPCGGCSGCAGCTGCAAARPKAKP